jgi:hypothetical protein
MDIHTRRVADSLTRRSFIGGSDARIITGQDEKALIRLWQEKRGEGGDSWRVKGPFCGRFRMSFSVARNTRYGCEGQCAAYHRLSRHRAVSGLSGFFTLTQSRDGPDRHGAPTRFDTACRNAVGPSSSVCPLNTMPAASRPPCARQAAAIEYPCR